MIDVVLAGTGGMIPLPDRWLTSMWLEYGGRACLIDCGEGTQIALNRHGIKLSRLETLLITHTHADHISGLAGLLLSLGNYGKTDRLEIYGHTGIKEVVEKLCCICPVLPFEVNVNELPDSEISSFRWNGFTISSFPLRHGVKCLGYSFVFDRKPVFNPQKAKELGIEVKYWKVLHSGENVEADGKIITPEMVTDGKRKPIKITYMTDTKFFPEMVGFAKDSDLLISEGMYGDDSYKGKMHEKKHMVFSESAFLAKKSESSLLWLTHYSPAFSNPEQYSESVRKIFANTVISRDGEKITLK